MKSERLIALECCSSKSREAGVCTGHQLSDTAKQLNLSKSELSLKLVNLEQEKTSCITRLPREMLKLKGSMPGQIPFGRSSHNGAQSPSQEHFPSIAQALSPSAQCKTHTHHTSTFSPLSSSLSGPLFPHFNFSRKSQNQEIYHKKNTLLYVPPNVN